MRMPALPITISISILLLLFSTPAAVMAQKGKAAGADKTGLAIGKKAPEFKLKDQTGKEVALKNLLTKGPVALVFHRSADW